jgi:hypothetical protein
MLRLIQKSLITGTTIFQLPKNAQVMRLILLILFYTS